MVQCELCGSEVEELTKTKVSGAELKVCSSCTSLGQTVDSGEDSDQDTKYSTTSSSDTSNSSQNKSTSRSKGRSGSNSGNQNSENPFDEVSNLAVDYGEKIQSGRSSQGMSREEFAQELGIKESYLRNIENQDTQPSVDLQDKIERTLDIDLSQSDDLGR